MFEIGLLHGLGVIGVILTMSVDVQREQEAARRQLLGHARARALTDGDRCPYCRDAWDPAVALDPEAAWTRCAGCGTRHHASCWGEHGGCSVHGCGRAEPRARAPIPLPVVGWKPTLDDPRG